MDVKTILDSKRDLSRYSNSELNILAKYFDIRASKKDLLWLLAIEILHGSQRGEMAGEGKEEAESTEEELEDLYALYEPIYGEDADEYLEEQELALQRYKENPQFIDVGRLGRAKMVELPPELLLFLSEQNYGYFYDRDGNNTHISIRPYLFFLNPDSKFFGQISMDILVILISLLLFSEIAKGFIQDLEILPVDFEESLQIQTKGDEIGMYITIYSEGLFRHLRHKLKTIPFADFSAEELFMYRNLSTLLIPTLGEVSRMENLEPTIPTIKGARK